MICEDSDLLGYVVVSVFMVNGVWKAFNFAVFMRKMVELQAFLTSQTTNPVTQQYIPEELNAMKHCSENLKSCIHNIF
jgi:hypothetical protein